MTGTISDRTTPLYMMLCNVCKDGLEGMWDPSRSKRLALLEDFLNDHRNLNNEDDSDDDNKSSHDSGKHEQFLGPRLLE